MASVTRRRRKIGEDHGRPIYGPDESWQVRYVDPTGRQRSKNFRLKADALNFANKVEVDKLTGGYIDPNNNRTTFKQYAEQWRAAQLHKPMSRYGIESRLRLHAYPTFGDRPIGTIRRTEIMAWVRELSENYSPNSVGSFYGVVAMVFKAAVIDGVIARSPCVGIKMPPSASKELVLLEVGQVHALAGALSERLQATVSVGAGLGLRAGEMLGLTVDRIDFLRHKVRIDRQLICVPNRPPEFGTPKTKASIRTIPLPDSVADTLAAHLATFGHGNDGLIFPLEDGTFLPRFQFSKEWRAAVTKAKLPKGTRFHDLRHFYASLLIESGASVKTVQVQLGHASATVTLDVYGHLWPTSAESTRTAVDGALGLRQAPGS